MNCSFLQFSCQELAFFIGSNAGYLILTFLPPIVWLLFYLREDEHPEPKRLIVATFIGGIIIAVPTALLQYYGVRLTGYSLWTLTENFPLATFGFMALVEEYAKFFVVYYLVTMRPDFDEPIDAMIYMMSAAMGFAAIENAFFSFPVFRGGFFSGIELVAGRFLGANLLHVLTSGVFGYFLARAFLSPYRSVIMFLGLAAATALHTTFNYLILVKGSVSEGVSYIVLFLLVAAIVVFAEFERLKHKKVNLIK